MSTILTVTLAAALTWKAYDYISNYYKKDNNNDSNYGSTNSQSSTHRQPTRERYIYDMGCCESKESNNDVESGPNRVSRLKQSDTRNVNLPVASPNRTASRSNETERASLLVSERNSLERRKPIVRQTTSSGIPPAEIRPGTQNGREQTQNSKTHLELLKKMRERNERRQAEMIRARDNDYNMKFPTLNGCSQDGQHQNSTLINEKVLHRNVKSYDYPGVERSNNEPPSVNTPTKTYSETVIKSSNKKLPSTSSKTINNSPSHLKQKSNQENLQPVIISTKNEPATIEPKLTPRRKYARDRCEQDSPVKTPVSIRTNADSSETRKNSFGGHFPSSDDNNIQVGKLPLPSLNVNIMDNLAPTSADNCEIVTLNQSLCNEDQRIVRNSINSVLLAYHLGTNGGERCNLIKLVCFVEQATIPMQETFKQYKGKNDNEKLIDFIRKMPKVFLIQNDFVSVVKGAMEWLEKAEFRFLKDFIVVLIPNGTTQLEDIAVYIVDTFSVQVFPFLGEVTKERLQLFVKGYPDEIGFVNEWQLRLLSNQNENSSIRQLSKGKKSELVTFFQTQLNLLEDKIFFEGLPIILSNKNPELLASLEDRKASSLLKILELSGLFDNKNGYVGLKGKNYTNAALNKPKSETTDVVSQSKLTAVAPKAAKVNSVHPKPNNVNVIDPFSSQTICCLVGTVVKVSFDSVVIMCANGKSTFAMAKRHVTLINGKSVANFYEALPINSYVAFSAKTSQQNGFIQWMASDIVLFLKTPICVCGSTLPVQKMHSREDFIVLQRFYFNLLGIVSLNEKTGYSIVCYRSSTELERIYVLCPANAMIVDGSGKPCKLSIGDKVECDVYLEEGERNISWECLWVAICVRKVSMVDMVASSSSNHTLWDCQGKITAVEHTGGLILTNVNIGFKYSNVYVPFEKDSVTLMPSEFGIGNLKSHLNVNQIIFFDAEPNNDSSMWIARFIRKSKRPGPVPPVNLTSLEDPKTNLTSLEDPKTNLTSTKEPPKTNLTKTKEPPKTNLTLTNELPKTNLTLTKDLLKTNLTSSMQIPPSTSFSTSMQNPRSTNFSSLTQDPILLLEKRNLLAQGIDKEFYEAEFEEIMESLKKPNNYNSAILEPFAISQAERNGSKTNSDCQTISTGPIASFGTISVSPIFKVS